MRNPHVLLSLLGAATVNVINARAMGHEDLEAERASAFDFYVAVRGAYVQFRDKRVHDRADDFASEAADDDLYYFDDDEEFEDE